MFSIKISDNGQRTFSYSCVVFIHFCGLEILTPPFFLSARTGGSVTLQAQAAVRRKMVFPPPCPAPRVSGPPLSPHLRSTPRPSSKLCSSPLRSPPPPLSPPAHRPLPFASKYSSRLVWLCRLFVNTLLQSHFSHTNSGFHSDSRQPPFSCQTHFYTFDTWLLWNEWIHKILFVVFVVSRCFWDGPGRINVMWFVVLMKCGGGCQITQVM